MTIQVALKWSEMAACVVKEGDVLLLVVGVVVVPVSSSQHPMTYTYVIYFDQIFSVQSGLRIS